MAASNVEYDFVHLLMNDIHARDSLVKISFKNIADFERDYESYNLTQLDSLRGADLYIIRIAENVSRPEGFIPYYDKLVKYLDTAKRNVIIVDGFWDKPVNKQIKEFALANGYVFILNSDLIADETNTAKGLFQNSGVSEHPSDKGMRAIECRIWGYIQVFFSTDVTGHRLAKR